MVENIWEIWILGTFLFLVISTWGIILLGEIREVKKMLEGLVDKEGGKVNE